MKKKIKRTWIRLKIYEKEDKVDGEYNANDFNFFSKG